MFSEKEMKEAYKELCGGMMGKDLDGVGLALFRLGVTWAESQMLHHIEDQNSLQFSEQAE